MIPALVTADRPADVVADYEAHVAGLPITLGARRDRIYRARRFMTTHPDLEVWMQRPTGSRLIDLHRVKAWPFATWLFVSGRRQPDLELLLTKPPGCDLPSVWATAHPDDVARVEQAALRLGWSPNWTRQVVILAASMICVWTNKDVDDLDDADFDAILHELDRSPAVTESARTRLKTRLFSFHHICFQLGVCHVAPRLGQPPALNAAEHAAKIPQPAIAREVIRYAETISTVLRPSTVQMRHTRTSASSATTSSPTPNIAATSPDNSTTSEPYATTPINAAGRTKRSVTNAPPGTSNTTSKPSNARRSLDPNPEGRLIAMK